MSEDLKFSIITVVFNDAVGLERTFKSVQSQTYKNYEHIIIDGASTDGTADVIEKYRDNKTRVTSELDEGIYDAMNKGFMQVGGDYFQMLNAGDKYAADDILSVVYEALVGKFVDIIYGEISFFNENFDQTRYWPAIEYKKWKVYMGWLPGHNTVIAKREYIEQFGLFDTKLYIAADTDMLLRWFLDDETKFQHLNKHMICMETGGASNASLKNIFIAWTQVTKAWFKYKPILSPITPTLKVLQKVVQLKILS